MPSLYQPGRGNVSIGTEAFQPAPCYSKGMKEGPDITTIAALIGDPARANMLGALMSGMALTAGELAREADVTPQTASSHLAKLTEAGLVLMTIQGRHRYFRLAGPDVAGALEGLMELASRMGHLRTRPGPRDERMRLARVCYNHLAGELGVRLHDALIEQGVVIATSGGLGLSTAGRGRLAAEGIDMDALERKPGRLCQACLDWSARRFHLSGHLGAALLQLVFQRGWARRDSESRAVAFSAVGRQQFEAFLSTTGQAPAVRSG
jgi:DNA-binding transcriptional ArsR family regulator